MATVPLSEAKTHLARLLSEVSDLGEVITITRSGRPVGVLLAVEEYEGLLETLELLADTELADAVRRGLEEIDSGEVLAHEQVWRELDHPLRRERR